MCVAGGVLTVLYGMCISVPKCKTRWLRHGDHDEPLLLHQAGRPMATRLFSRMSRRRATHEACGFVHLDLKTVCSGVYYDASRDDVCQPRVGEGLHPTEWFDRKSQPMAWTVHRANGRNAWMWHGKLLVSHVLEREPVAV